MILQILQLAVVAVLLLPLAGCASRPEARPPLPVVEVEPPDPRLVAAERALAAGETERAVAIWRALAAEGVIEAQLQLAALHLRGRGVPRDPAEAARLLERAAAASSPAALRELGELHLEGPGVRRDPARGEALLARAAALGDGPAQLRLALRTADDPSAEPAARTAAEGTIEQLARDGLVAAQLALADRLAEGRGRRRDPLEAARWYAVALEPLRAEALGGEPRAQERLGDLYRDGRGVPADGRTAAEWYRKAAEAGRISALLRLARLAERGAPGLAPDPAEAVRWLELAAARGDAVATYDLARKRLAGQGGAADPAAALGLFQRAATLGERRAWRWIGELHEDPNGPAFDLNRAVEHYRLAAGIGDGKAMFKLAELHEKGRLRDADPVVAAAWYRLAAEHGYARGAERLARVEARLQPDERRRALQLAAAWRPAPARGDEMEADGEGGGRPAAGAGQIAGAR